MLAEEKYSLARRRCGALAEWEVWPNNRRGNERLMLAHAATGWDVEVFYDGDCPLCMREMRMLMNRDRHGRIRFTDIASHDFEPSQVGLTRAELMAKIHGRLPSGEIIEGVEVFRQLYAATGLRLPVALSRVPGVSQLLDVGYRAFARNRLRLTGRCHDGACEVPQHSMASK